MRVRRTAGALVVGAVVIAGASACGNPLRDLQEKVVESGIEKIIESGTGVEGVDFSGAELPANFPSDLPLPDEELRASFHLTENGVTTWTLSYQSERAEAFAAYVSQLESSGFSEQTSGALGDLMDLVMYTNDAYSVSVMSLTDDTESMLQVIVQEREE